MIEEYNELIEKIVTAYISKLSKDIYNEEIEPYDIDIMDYNGILQWPINFSDFFFSLDDILMAYKHNINWNIFIKYYDYNLECYTNEIEPRINLYNYRRKEVLSSEDLAKDHKEEIEKSKKRVEKAKEELENIINNKKW